MRFVMSLVVSASVFASLLASGCSSKITGSGQPYTDGGTSPDGVTGRGDPLPSNGSSRDAGTEPPPGETTTTCGEAAVCASDCPDDATSDACVEACLAGLSRAEVAKLNDVAACMEGSGCGDDDECVQQTCATELHACAGS